MFHDFAPNPVSKFASWWSKGIYSYIFISIINVSLFSRGLAFLYDASLLRWPMNQRKGRGDPNRLFPLSLLQQTTTTADHCRGLALAHLPIGVSQFFPCHELDSISACLNIAKAKLRDSIKARAATAILVGSILTQEILLRTRVLLGAILKRRPRPQNV